MFSDRNSKRHDDTVLCNYYALYHINPGAGYMDPRKICYIRFLSSSEKMLFKVVML
jgi:hypothetical protein